MTEHCNLCNFMATAYENLVKHLKLVIRQLREIVTRTESSVDEDELLELVDTINDLALQLTD